MELELFEKITFFPPDPPVLRPVGGPGLPFFIAFDMVQAWVGQNLVKRNILRVSDVQFLQSGGQF